MDDKKAYGVIAALGKSYGEAARADATLLPALRGVSTPEAFTQFLRAHPSALPTALVEDFAAMLTPQNAAQWRAKLVLQVKMIAEGGKPAPGHEGPSRGVKGK